MKQFIFVNFKFGNCILDWNDFKRYLNDGIQANSFKQFHFVMIKIQVNWIAFLGQPRWHFNMIAALGLPLTALCFWIGYLTNFTSQDTSSWPLLSIIIWQFILVPAKVLPIAYPIHILVSIITGAFTTEFWNCVYLIRSNTPKK